MYAGIFALTFFILTAILYTMPRYVLEREISQYGIEIEDADRFVTDYIEDSARGITYAYTKDQNAIIEAYRVHSMALNMISFMRYIGVISAAIAIGLSYLFTPRLFDPLNDILEATKRLGDGGSFGQRLPNSDRPDIFGELAVAINQTLNRMERLLRAQQQFLADVSHELRTPLTAVRGNADLMRQAKTYDDESIMVIQEESARMGRLVDDLLLLARADTGGLPMRQQRVQLDDLFFEVFRKMQVLQKKTRVTLAVKEIDQVAVIGDPDRLDQVMINLVDNAIKYTTAGGTVEMSLSQADGMAQLVIRDNGIGIPPEDLPYIFNRFYRVDKARARAQGGSGLGLSIVEWIVDAHQGKIEVESEVGVGTTFTVYLPIMPQPVEGEEEDEQPSRMMVLLPWLRRNHDDTDESGEG
jgi:signal transduction histidine kinase